MNALLTGSQYNVAFSHMLSANDYSPAEALKGSVLKTTINRSVVLNNCLKFAPFEQENMPCPTENQGGGVLRHHASK